MRRRICSIVALAVCTACGDDDVPVPVVRIGSAEVVVEARTAPFELVIQTADGQEVLRTTTGSSGSAYAGLSATIDTPTFAAQTLPGWDGYGAGEAAWRAA